MERGESCPLGFSMCHGEGRVTRGKVLPLTSADLVKGICRREEKLVGQEGAAPQWEGQKDPLLPSLAPSGVRPSLLGGNLPLVRSGCQGKAASKPAGAGGCPGWCESLGSLLSSLPAAPHTPHSILERAVPHPGCHRASWVTS